MLKEGRDGTFLNKVRPWGSVCSEWTFRSLTSDIVLMVNFQYDTTRHIATPSESTIYVRFHKYFSKCLT